MWELLFQAVLMYIFAILVDPISKNYTQKISLFNRKHGLGANLEFVAYFMCDENKHPHENSIDRNSWSSLTNR